MYVCNSLQFSQVNALPDSELEEMCSFESQFWKSCYLYNHGRQRTTQDIYKTWFFFFLSLLQSQLFFSKILFSNLRKSFKGQNNSSTSWKVLIKGVPKLGKHVTAPIWSFEYIAAMFSITSILILAACCISNSIIYFKKIALEKKYYYSDIRSIEVFKSHCWKRNWGDQIMPFFFFFKLTVSYEVLYDQGAFVWLGYLSTVEKKKGGGEAWCKTEY